jgi:hypothetical protein
VRALFVPGADKSADATDSRIHDVFIVTAHDLLT